ncbi:hypothetical protein, partial [Kribbella albertanoniae]|uniref:hypothetical protein n=1 Tax=Kribbella albertanoniae TaxID=1266829 RepID=UPI001EDF4404
LSPTTRPSAAGLRSRAAGIRQADSDDRWLYGAAGSERAAAGPTYKPDPPNAVRPETGCGGRGPVVRDLRPSVGVSGHQWWRGRRYRRAALRAGLFHRLAHAGPFGAGWRQLGDWVW